jgi:hypothetical protein
MCMIQGQDGKIITTAIPPPWHLYPDGADACWDCALWKIPVAYDRLPSRGRLPLSIPCQQHGDFALERLGSQPLGALT